MTSNDKPKMSCACVHPDAQECIRARYPPSSFDLFDMEDEGLFDEEVCECCCHHADEDGRDDWDRYFDELKEWKEENDQA